MAVAGCDSEKVHHQTETPRAPRGELVSAEEIMMGMAAAPRAGTTMGDSAFLTGGASGCAAGDSRWRGWLCGRHTLSFALTHAPRRLVSLATLPLMREAATNHSLLAATSCCVLQRRFDCTFARLAGCTPPPYPPPASVCCALFVSVEVAVTRGQE